MISLKAILWGIIILLSKVVLEEKLEKKLQNLPKEAVLVNLPK